MATSILAPGKPQGIGSIPTLSLDEDALPRSLADIVEHSGFRCHHDVYLCRFQAWLHGRLRCADGEREPCPMP